MLLPQSSAFGALKNRLNSVSAIGLLHTPASMPTSARPSVVAGMSSASLPSATSTGTVSGRLGRTRDVNAASDVKWPELMEKFKQTQEKARRRNERLLRGGDADGAYVGPTSATRSLLDSAIGNGGRESRTSNRSAEAGGRSGGGRNSALGRPLSLVGASGAGGAAGLSRAGSNFPGGSSAVAAGIAGAVASGDGRVAPHKRGHSLAGGLGKFASGIARAGGSKDRDKDKGKR
jgi:hypothetical protein